ncbi:symmetrical bis(5'-nucleosyl)-tetraphosphatase [Cardiobacteriaceae bacterium TAE3-ERU3]|nr:symmetrical bis(5'-nucleosyl)-tetraphosphatase [Cardiobacteriaceae bacterium TAE3-ERU3]
MAVYAIGDVHGQYDALCRLLDAVKYGNDDQLWFVGDLVNRGPDSLGVLRLVRDLGARAKVVLGNHDFSMLVQAQAFKDIKIKKSTQAILTASDGEELIEYLRNTPMMQLDEQLGVVMVHAGWYPRWTVADAVAANEQICSELRGSDCRRFLRKVYDDEPRCYEEALKGKKIDRARFAVNAFCRMRYLDRKQCLELTAKMPPEDAPAVLTPWYDVASNLPYKLVFGHWASLGLRVGKQFACIDAGAAWGGSLVAFDLERWAVAAQVSVS